MSKFIKPNNTKIGFQNAWAGLIWAFNHQINLKRHLLAMLIVITIGLILQISYLEWLIILTVIYSVIVIELINTSLEQTTDAITLEYNLKIKQAKDSSAAAVLIYAIYAVTIGILIFGPKLLALFTS